MYFKIIKCILRNIIQLRRKMSAINDSNLGNDTTAGSSGGIGEYSDRMNKQHHSANVLHRISGTFEDKSNDYLCPICFEVIDEAHITRCGHTFCYRCIVKSLEANGRCPKCSYTLTQQDIFPNFLLHELISKYKTRIKGFAELGSSYAADGKHKLGNTDLSVPPHDGLRDIIAAESANLTLPDVNVMLEVLTQRKHLLEAETCAAQNKLLHEFLKHLLQQKEEQKNQLQKEIALIKRDMDEVENILRDVQNKCPKVEDLKKSSENDTAHVSAIRKEMIGLIDIIDSNMVKPNEKANISSDTFINPTGSKKQNDYAIGSTLATRRKRMHAHFDDFVQCYFDSRAKELLLGHKSQSQSDSWQGTSSRS
uniref:E3 ubiquitin-protein ligase RFWD2 n=1 Tax=Apis cerana TaxID=7461 RepID=V9IMB5_APICE